MNLLPILSAALLGLASLAHAQDIKTPNDPMGSYDPTLSAKEALMANWELAASGIRAGSVVAQDTLSRITPDTPFEELRRKANFTLDLMIKRYNSANWAITTQDQIAAIDGTTLLTLAQTASQPCDGPCSTERAALITALTAAADQMKLAHSAADAAVKARKETRDSTLMVEQLSAIADYLESDGWYTGLDLTAVHRDREEVQARLVGTMVLWRNVEPYVGLTSPEIDTEINAASDAMLRDMRRVLRGKTALDTQAPEFGKLTTSAKTLAQAMRRAAGLFAS